MRSAIGRGDDFWVARLYVRAVAENGAENGAGRSAPAQPGLTPRASTAGIVGPALFAPRECDGFVPRSNPTPVMEQP